MTYFADLTPHVYGGGLDGESGWTMFNVGWLDDDAGPATDFRASAKFLEHLRDLCASPVRRFRGLHPCGICKAKNVYKTPFLTRNGRTWMLGSAEILVPGRNPSVNYVAPDLIHHYISDHDYCPPEAFVSAVLAEGDKSMFFRSFEFES